MQQLQPPGSRVQWRDAAADCMQACAASTGQSHSISHAVHFIATVVVTLWAHISRAVGAAIERCCSSSGGLWQDETARLHSRLLQQQAELEDARDDLQRMQLQMQQHRSTMMAMQVLRGKAADSVEVQGIRQKLAESQALVLELQIEQVMPNCRA